MTQDVPAKRLLIANRGEIAYRILKTARHSGYFVISIYTSTDVTSPHVAEADLSLLVSSYTNVPEIVELLKQHGVQYVIPGYGFLSENELFAAEVQHAGAVFVGPNPEHISTFGIKDRARALASSIGVPICSGSPIVDTEDDAVVAAAQIGYPIMLKATAGGGGMGLQICEDEDQLRSSFANVTSRGAALFSNPGVFLERYYPVSRHIEVQIFGNGLGECAVFGERECSIQRRHQKVIEESPSPFVEARPDLRRRLFEVSKLLGQSIKYASAGTVEYLVDDSTGDFFFLEMNTRLQVEHGITELRFGVDLVELMLRQAAGALDLSEFDSIVPKGAAIEARIYAENPLKNYMPCPGLLQHVEFGSGPGVRVDTWVKTGSEITLTYDPLVAKVMGYGATRADAIATIVKALEQTKLQGIMTNLDAAVKILASAKFADGDTTTNFLADFDYSTQAMEIIAPGSYTTIQDWPGRIGIGFGIPEGGPMDSLHARLANIVVGNDQTSELLEITFSGPKVKFHGPATFALAGAGEAPEMSLDGNPVPMWTRVDAPKGSVLTIGQLTGGCRAYLAIKGGFPGVPVYLGSKATTPVVGIGGVQGRQLVAGDWLELCDAVESKPFTLPKELIPVVDLGTVYCLSGPHDSPEIITPEGLEELYAAEWTVTHQASRLGVRLSGPQPKWARKTGGEGGSHPSNYIDYPYSVGALNWTGDTAVIFPADSPSLGGFISSCVVPRAELFKVGQMRPSDVFHFVQISVEAAVDLRKRQDDFLDRIQPLAAGESSSAVKPLSLKVDVKLGSKVVSHAILEKYKHVTIRQAGDSCVLMEFQQSVDLEVRCEVQSMVEVVERAKIDGVRLVTPMGCSLLVEYDCFQLTQASLVQVLRGMLELQLENNTQSRKLSSRIIRLPMVFDDKVNKDSIERYMALQRPYASYLPDPVEFIARSNGLDNKKDVLSKVLSTKILVLGIGFFSGTPIGIPLDPRARLMVPKFNPSRTFSPAGGLGIGGGFFSCDPIDAPGGYVNFGRTLPGWDKFCVNKSFGDRPWLFQNFDQLSFYNVDEEEFERIYDRFMAGKFDFDITPTQFDVDEYFEFCRSVASETEEFKSKQAEATKRENEREAVLLAQWQEEQKSPKDQAPSLDDIDDAFKIQAQMHASVYKIKLQKRSIIKAGDVLLVLESMKMEINVIAAPEQDGMVVQSILINPGDIVKPGDTMLLIGPAENDVLA